MTPGARVAAAAEIIDRIQAGEAAERALTTWARSSRFAGSKDRRAVRDHVFGVLRRWWSTAFTGGGETGRARLIGALVMDGIPPGEMFTGEGHAPPALSEVERAAIRDPAMAPDHIRADLPGWIFERLTDEHGARAAFDIGQALRDRAAVHLRANLGRTDREGAARALAGEGIETRPHPLAGTALEVVEGALRVAASAAYQGGLVELQDAASQAVVERLGEIAGLSTLDFCAGGGGKALALAARGANVTVHDIDPARMRDLPARAARAGVTTRNLAARDAGFDLVLADAPCSGSGAWRRQPEAKLRLSEARLGVLNQMQDEVLTEAAGRVGPGGRLAYATCSILACENAGRVDDFLARSPGWRLIDRHDWSPIDGADGFHLSVMRRG